MTLTQLRYMAAIVDTSFSMTAAACKIHVTQSGISKQLKQLEEELGFEVFVRHGKTFVMLTEGGCVVLEIARRILNDTSRIKSMSQSR